MIEITHDWQNEKKNFRQNVKFDDDVRMEILWCTVHEKYELLIDNRVVSLPYTLVIQKLNERN